MSHRHRDHCCEKKCCCDDYRSYECGSPIFSCFGNLGCGTGCGTGSGSGLIIIIIIIIILCLCKGRW